MILILLSLILNYNHPSYPFNGVQITDRVTGVAITDGASNYGHIVVIPDAKVIYILYKKQDKKLSYLNKVGNTYNITSNTKVIIGSTYISYYSEQYVYRYSILVC